MSPKVVASNQKLRAKIHEQPRPEVAGKPPAGFEPKNTVQRLKWVEQSTGLNLEGMPLPRLDELHGIIENHVGYVPVPMSIAAPLLVHGDYARGEFIVPLCTLEGTLTLAMSRGLQAIAMAGGCRTIHLKQELSRSPAFCLPTITEIDSFLRWISDHADSILAVAESTTRQGRLLRVDPTPIQQWVVLDFVYDTGNAAGQNTVTLATEAACRYIHQETGFHYYLESGFNSDKRPSRRNLMCGRGHSVTVEYSLGNQVLDFLGVRQEAVLDFQQLATSSSQAIGMLGDNLHLSSALAAIYLATGQDIACLAENAIAFSQASPDGGDGLLFRMTLPSLTVGTVGGGTRLPVQRRNLELIGCGDRLHDSRKLAEIIAAAAAAVELSVLAAVVSGKFAQAPENYGLARGKQER
ncbi:MAG: hydroxymethylglutaryl-CoA reductase [Isosphaeraceae bacterium]